MNRFGRAAVFSTLSIALLAGPAFAQDDHHDDRRNQNQSYDHRDDHGGYVEHKEWRKGYHMRHEDWDRAQRVDDWKAHHLRQPPRGYEWRQVDGNYGLANVNPGVISLSMAIR